MAHKRRYNSEPMTISEEEEEEEALLLDGENEAMLPTKVLVNVIYDPNSDFILVKSQAVGYKIIFIGKEKTITIAPEESVKIDTGISLDLMPDKYALLEVNQDNQDQFEQGLKYIGLSLIHI